MPVDRVTIGRVVKPHGLRGEVVVEVLSDVPGRFDAGVEVSVGGRRAVIASSRPHQSRMLVRFDHVGDRDAAEALRGQVLEAEPLDEDDHPTYFAHELVGMQVVGENGEALGVVATLIELPAAAGYDLLEVSRDDGPDWMLPAADDLVVAEPGDDGVVRLRLVSPPEGLVDAVPGDADNRQRGG